MVVIRAGIEKQGSSLPRLGKENELEFPAEPQSAEGTEQPWTRLGQGRCHSTAVASARCCVGNSSAVAELGSASCTGLCREGCGASPRLGNSPVLRREL